MIKEAIIVTVFCTILSGLFVESKQDMSEFPLGIRLSNPGNIEHDEDNDWQGKTRLQDNKRFVRFKSPHYGIRALVKLLINYRKLHNCETISDIINRYAPPSENKTLSYIRDVSARSGYFPNELLDMGDILTLMRISQAIIIHENGIAPLEFPAAWYEDDIYIRAIEDALRVE